jgi:hypothetical protein
MTKKLTKNHAVSLIPITINILRKWKLLMSGGGARLTGEKWCNRRLARGGVGVDSKISFIATI